MARGTLKKSQSSNTAFKPRNIFLRDVATLRCRQQLGTNSSQHLGTNNSKTPEPKSTSVTYVDPPTNQVPAKKHVKRRARAHQDAQQSKKVETCCQSVVYECPKCKSLSSGEVRVEKQRNRKRWRFIIYGVDPMPIPPPAPRADPPPSPAPPPPATQPVVPKLPTSTIKITNDHLAYPVNKRRRYRKRKHLFINQPIWQTFSMESNKNASWQNIPLQQPLSFNALTGAAPEPNSTSLSTSENVDTSTTQGAIPYVVIPSCTLPCGDQSQQAPVNTEEPEASPDKTKITRKRSPTGKRPRNLEKVVDFHAFLKAAKAAGIHIVERRRVRPRATSEPLGQREGRKKRGRPKSKLVALKQSTPGSKQSINTEAKAREMESEDSVKQKKTEKKRIRRDNKKIAQSEKAGESGDASGDVVKGSSSDVTIRPPGTTTLLEARPASAHTIAKLIRKCRQREREKSQMYSNLNPLLSRYRSYAGSVVEDTDDSTSSNRLLTSIEAVKIVEKATGLKPKKKKMRKTSSAPSTAVEGKESKAESENKVASERRHDSEGNVAAKAPKDPETMLKEFRARLQEVQGKGSIKASHIEVMAYLEGKQASGKSFSYLPKTYQQLGLPPLLRSPSSENVLPSDMRFICALEDSQATGEPTVKQDQPKASKRRQSISNRPKTASVTAAASKSRAGGAAGHLKHTQSNVASDVSMSKSSKKDLRRTESAVKGEKPSPPSKTDVSQQA